MIRLWYSEPRGLDRGPEPFLCLGALRSVAGVGPAGVLGAPQFYKPRVDKGSSDQSLQTRRLQNKKFAEKSFLALNLASCFYLVLIFNPFTSS